MELPLYIMDSIQRLQCKLDKMPTEDDWPEIGHPDKFKATTTKAKDSVMNFIKDILNDKYEVYPQPHGGIIIESDNWEIKFDRIGEIE